MDLQKLACHLKNEGFILDLSKINENGKWNVVALDDNSIGKKSGSFKIVNNICIYHNFKTGITKTYNDNTTLKRDDYIQFKQDIFKNQQNLKKQKFLKSKESFIEFQHIEIGESSEYLNTKKVLNFGCKIDKNGNLIVPFRNDKGYITTYQTIYPNGNKIFKKEAEVKGSSHAIGFNKIFFAPEKYVGKIFITEGYATGASVHMATNQPTIIAANAGNLLPVLERFKQKYQNAEFIICADWDLKLIELDKNRYIWNNTGVDKAIECQNIYKTQVVVPDFSKTTSDLRPKMSDFNDIHCFIGLEEISQQIKCQINNKIKEKSELCQEK